MSSYGSQMVQGGQSGIGLMGMGSQSGFSLFFSQSSNFGYDVMISVGNEISSDSSLMGSGSSSVIGSMGVSSIGSSILMSSSIQK